MAHIEKSVEGDNELTIFTVVGEVDVDDVLTQVMSFLTGTPTPLVLWNLTAGTLERISPQQLRMIVDRAAPLSDRRRGGRTAILCVRDLDFGLSRMVQIFAELMHTTFEIGVFRGLTDAREWLGQVRKT